MRNISKLLNYGLIAVLFSLHAQGQTWFSDPEGIYGGFYFWESGDLYPSFVSKGYPVAFIAYAENNAPGDEEDPHRDDPNLFTYREIQIRQSEDGKSWSDWVNIEPPLRERYPYLADWGEVYEFEETRTNKLYNKWRHEEIYCTPVTITGSFVQVRQRVNNTQIPDEDFGYTIPEGYKSLTTDWRVTDVEVISDGYERWIDPYSYLDVSLAYLEDFVPLSYTPMDWERPDYHHLPYSSGSGETAFPEKLPGFPYDSPSDEWRDAYIARINYFRRLAGVTPVVRSAAEYEYDTQMAALALHIISGGSHSLFNPETIPMDDPGRKYYPKNATEVYWAVSRGSFGFLGDRTAWDEGGDATIQDWREPYYQSVFMEPVMNFMDDQYAQNFNVGHRRSLLNPTVRDFAVGSTLATILEGEHAPNFGEEGTPEGYNVYPEAQSVVAPDGDIHQFEMIYDAEELYRDEGVLFSSPGMIPYDLVPARISGDAIPIEPLFIEPEDRESHPGRVFHTDQQHERHELQARAWRNGEELPTYMTWAHYDGNTGYLDFVFEIDETFVDLLEEDHPDYSDNVFGDRLEFTAWLPAAVYPKPRNKVDEIRVQISLHPTPAQRAEFGLDRSVVLYEYAFYPFVPHIVFGDEVQKKGDWIRSERMGWYYSGDLPWAWVQDEEKWVYSGSTDENPSDWFFDHALQDWCAFGPGGWIYLNNRGWAYPIEDSKGNKLYYLAETDQWVME